MSIQRKYCIKPIGHDITKKYSERINNDVNHLSKKQYEKKIIIQQYSTNERLYFEHLIEKINVNENHNDYYFIFLLKV